MENCPLFYVTLQTFNTDASMHKQLFTVVAAEDGASFK